MSKKFEGWTVDAEAPFVGAEFWPEGRTISGIVSKIFDTDNEEGGVRVKTRAYVLLIQIPVELDGEEWDRVSIGSLAGFKMAMDAAGISGLLLKDIVTLTCEGKSKAKKEGYSDRLNFKLSVERV